MPCSRRRPTPDDGILKKRNGTNLGDESSIELASWIPARIANPLVKASLSNVIYTRKRMRFRI